MDPPELWMDLGIPHGSPRAAGGFLHLPGFPMEPHGGAKLLHHGPHHGLQRNLGSSSWSTSCPSFSTDPAVSLLFPSHVLPFPSSLARGKTVRAHLVLIFFLNLSSQRPYQPLSLAQLWPEACPSSEPSGIGSAGHGRSFQQLLTAATSVVPTLPKTRP